MDHVKLAQRWMRNTYGRAVLAPMTGQDARAWAAFVLLLGLYAAGDSRGRRHALKAMGSCVLAAQSHVSSLFLNVVPFVVDGREGAILHAQLSLVLDDVAEAAALDRAYDDRTDEPQD